MKLNDLDPDRFWSRVVVTDDAKCWLWRLTPDRDGYGRFKTEGRHIGAHRAAWMLHNGAEIPTGSLVIHSCDNPRCCNPAHLRLGTVADNVADRVSRGRGAKGRKPNMAASGKNLRTRIETKPPKVSAADRLLAMLTDKKRQRKQWLASLEPGGEGGIRTLDTV